LASDAAAEDGAAPGAEDALDMVGRFYGNHGCFRPAACVCALAVAMLSACDRTPPAPPAPAGPSAQALEAALRSTESYLAAQRPREALRIAAQLAIEAPGRMDAHEMHARCLVAVAFDAGSTEAERTALLGQAADAYDRAAALAPGMAPLRHAAGVVSSTAGRHEAALAHYRAAHEAEPASAQYALYYGVALAAAGQLAEARAQLVAAERLSPESPDPRAALADLAVREGDLAAARAAIAKARELDRASVPLRLADARIRRLDRHPNESLDLLLALDPPQRLEPGVAQEIALAHIALGDRQAAAVVLENSAAAAPADWRRAIRCAQAWQAAGDPVKAQVWLQAALASGAPADALDTAMNR